MASAQVETLFGRDAECAELIALLGHRDLGPKLLTLYGEAGIGKTALWRFALREAEARGLNVRSCHCVEAELELPFTALADLFDPLAPEDLFGLPAPQRHALGVALLRDDEGDDGPVDPRAVGTGLLGLLRVWSADGPLLMAIDDGHWMDAASANALTFAVRRLAHETMALLVTRRVPGPATGLPTNLVLPGGTSQVVRLERLSRDDVRRLLVERVGSIDRAHSLRIHEASGGNPYFALELGRSSGGRDDPDRSMPLPASLGQLVARRVADQTSEVRRLLLTAAAATRPTTQLAVQILGPVAEGALATAENDELLTSKDGELLFVHPLLAAAAYWDASAEQRREIHRDLAEAVHEPEERARHLALAVVGADERVARFLEEVAAATLARGAPEHAARLWELAAAISPSRLADARRRRWMEAADCRFHAGDGARAEMLLQRVLTESPPGRDTAEALRRMARMRYHDDSVASAVPLLEEAVLQATGSPDLLVSLHRDLGWAHASVGAVDVAMTHAVRAEALLPEATSEVLASSVWAVSAVVHCLAGHGADLDRLDRAVATQLMPEPLIAFDARSCRAQVLKWTDRFDESRTSYQDLRHELTTRGSEGSLPFLLFQESELECWAGEYATAARLAATGREVAELTGQRSHFALCEYVGALVDVHRGQVGSARATFEHLLQGPGESVASIQAWVHTGLGFLELSVGNAAAAHRNIEPFSDMAMLTGLREPGVFRFVPDEVEALLALGDVDRADKLATDLEESGRRLDRVYALATGARCRGMVAAARGDQVACRTAFELALQMHERLP
ncbi:MAG: AAA family ATPase [Nocardioidaceae bacterium]|nr:AAA family ATPase [Nocardioidaceae bacterium]